AGAVVGILESLGTHAHHHAINTAIFVTAEKVKIVEVRGLIFEQHRAVAMARGESAGADGEGRRPEAETLSWHVLLLLEVTFQTEYERGLVSDLGEVKNLTGSALMN